MKTRSTFIDYFICIFLLSSSLLPSYAADIQVGEEKEHVIAVLGEPITSATSGNKETIYYKNTESENTSRQPNQIKLGDTKEQVAKILGKPSLSFPSGERETYLYRKGMVDFVNNRVVYFYVNSPNDVAQSYSSEREYNGQSQNEVHDTSTSDEYLRALQRQQELKAERLRLVEEHLASRRKYQRQVAAMANQRANQELNNRSESQSEVLNKAYMATVNPPQNTMQVRPTTSYQQNYSNDGDDEYNYEGSSGQRYKYDLSKPIDQRRYSIDPSSQLNDRLKGGINVGVRMDQNRGQYGGGIKP